MLLPKAKRAVGAGIKLVGLADPEPLNVELTNTVFALNGNPVRLKENEAGNIALLDMDDRNEYELDDDEVKGIQTDAATKLEEMRNVALKKAKL